MPPYVSFFLDMVHILTRYGRFLDKVLHHRTAHPNFPTLAANFGTHDIRRIIAHVTRGILRAMVLKQYLLALAAQGRELEVVPRKEPATEEEIAALKIKLRPSANPRPRRPFRSPYDPLHFYIPTAAELLAQVRSRPVGQTLMEICLDLGITAACCDGETWDVISRAIADFGGSINAYYEVVVDRRRSFEKERQRRPDTWDIDWRDHPRAAIRALLGWVLGEEPPGELA